MTLRAACLVALFLLAWPAGAQTHFGYAGVMCGLEAEGEDFAAEVAPFTNIAHVCPTGDMTEDAARLARAHGLGLVPLYHVEPVFFQRNGARMTRRRTLDLWRLTLRTVEASGVPPSEIVFYVADEPWLAGLRPRALEAVLERIEADLPEVRTMVITAYRDRHPPVIPLAVDYWGFAFYALHDPAAEGRYMRHLEQASARLLPHQQLVLVMDATHTPIHAEAGLTDGDMADVARAYAALAARTGRVAMLLAYAWPGGIEWEDELGARDLPPEVRAAHEAIGRAITGR